MGWASRMLKALLVSPTNDRVITLEFITRLRAGADTMADEDCVGDDMVDPTADNDSDDGDNGPVDEEDRDVLASGVRKS